MASSKGKGPVACSPQSLLLEQRGIEEKMRELRWGGGVSEDYWGGIVRERSPRLGPCLLSDLIEPLAAAAIRGVCSG